MNKTGIFLSITLTYKLPGKIKPLYTDGLNFPYYTDGLTDKFTLVPGNRINYE